MMIEAAAESTQLKAIVSEGASSRSVRDELANPGGGWQELIGNGVVTVATAIFNLLQLSSTSSTDDAVNVSS